MEGAYRLEKPSPTALPVSWDLRQSWLETMS